MSKRDTRMVYPFAFGRGGLRGAGDCVSARMWPLRRAFGYHRGTG
jgi:hypothetical protein